ncbi:MAG: hypothetical protein CMJ84_00830 [Planctomycetes bacterium]|jgi:hypothetical protein|nr:hypothetical protein [Planctomycetota bacterium]MDP6408580.1 Ig-like domain-containing protein [Planctomycetota bacterium]
MQSTPKRIDALAMLLGTGVLAVLCTLSGCDNPACVFGGDCSSAGGSGDPGSEGQEFPAVFPEDGEWLESASPTVQAVFPAADASPTSPIVITFSESMAPDSLEGAFELLQDDGAGGGLPLPLAGSALLGDGRVVVLVPPPLLAGTTYTLRVAETGSPHDLTGHGLLAASDRVLGTFGVALNLPTDPQIVATWPPEDTVDQSATTEVVVVFDRVMDPTTVTGSSFQVTVDGADPVEDPDPEVLVLTEFGGTPVVEPRIYTWRSVDSAGSRVGLGAPGATVRVELSPLGGSSITAATGQALPNTAFDFDLVDFPSPLSASILSVPFDAIGIDNLLGTTPLEVGVLLDVEAAAGDELGIFLFGADPDDESSLIIALERTAPLAEGSTSRILDAEELGLLVTSDPLEAVLGDGDLAFAFQVRRGNAAGPVTLLDVVAEAGGVQDAVLDTVPPSLLGLGSDGSQLSEVRFGLRELAVVGLASEELRSVEVSVTTDAGAFSNGVLPAVAGSDSDGRFVARGVSIGQLTAAEQPALLEVRIYDRALNSADEAVLELVQLGASGPGAALPGGEVFVTVFDTYTHAPLVGAQVFTHEEIGGKIDPAALDMELTDADGRAVLDAATAGETLVTVDAAGYDLFTFQGVPTDRLDVPMTPSGLALTPVTAGVLSSSAELVNFASRFADSRSRLVEVPLPGTGGGVVMEGDACVFDPFLGQTVCTTNPYTVAPLTLGALTFFSVDFAGTIIDWTPDGFLRAFLFSFPRPELAPGSGGTEGVTLNEPTILDALPDERSPIGLSLLPILDPTASGLASPIPSVRVEALVAGVTAPVVVGLGQAFDSPVPVGSSFLRAAYPGVVDGIADDAEDELGALVTGGVVDGDLFLHAELDGGTARTGVRPRFSGLPAVPTATLTPVAVPVVTSPVANTGGHAFDIEFNDVLPDAQGQPGLYRATVRDALGRRWVLWRFDPADAAGGEVALHVPDLSLLGDPTPLAEGFVSLSVSLFAWPGLDAGEFLWSDAERLHELFAHGPEQVLLLP